MRTEGLNYWKNDFTIATVNGISLNVVKSSVDVGFHIGVQSVKVHHLQQWLAVDAPIGNIGQLSTRRVAQILDIELEILFVD